jgi:transposase
MDISEVKRREIVNLHLTNLFSNRAISDIVNVPRRTVDRMVRLWRETGNVASRRLGRPPTNHTLSERTERALVRRSVVDPRLTARQIRNQQGGDTLNVSVRTIQRVLQRHGRIAYRPTAAPALNSQRKRTRLEWARRYKDWTSEDWSKVSFEAVLNFKIAKIIVFVLFIFYFTGYFFR